MVREYVVAQNTPEGGQRFLCKHCGTYYDPALPCPLNVFIAAMDAFGMSHANCLPPDPLDPSSADPVPPRPEGAGLVGGNRE